jgi:hypothetical protein
MKLLLIVAICVGIAPAALALERAGVAAAVRGQVARANDMQPLGLSLASGEPIYAADRISSGPGSGVQVMLRDQTTLTIGPDSSVGIDKFDYDPSTNLGKVTASLGMGAFRIAAGKAAATDASGVTVKLPAATIRIRGSTVYGRAEQNGAIVGLAGFGLDNDSGDKLAGIEVITPDGTARVRRPGWGIVLEAGKPPVVQKLPASTVDAILASVSLREPARTRAVPAMIANAVPSLATFRAGQDLHRDGNRLGRTAADNPGNGFGCVVSSGCTGFNSGDGALIGFARLAGIATGPATSTPNNVPVVISASPGGNNGGSSKGSGSGAGGGSSGGSGSFQDSGSGDFVLTVNFGSNLHVINTGGVVLSSNILNIPATGVPIHVLVSNGRGGFTFQDRR